VVSRVDYNRFVATWRVLHSGPDGADAIDAQLHAERIDPTTRGQLRHSAPLAVLPDGAYVLRAGRPFVVCGRHLLAWSPTGYTRRLRRPHNEVAEVITPPSVVAVLRSGWEGAVPFLHPSPHG
jgi:hypothetical protein